MPRSIDNICSRSANLTRFSAFVENVDLLSHIFMYFLSKSESLR